MSTQPSASIPNTGPLPQADAPASSLEVEDQAQAAIIHRTVEVLGDRSDAMRWLGTPVRALNYATPVSLLHDPKGREDVLAVLGRLEHGVL
jgi:putative toxin-antitoxin system antitoxin component (TIGR02293 family)